MKRIMLLLVVSLALLTGSASIAYAHLTPYGDSVDPTSEVLAFYDGSKYNISANIENVVGWDSYDNKWCANFCGVSIETDQNDSIPQGLAVWDWRDCNSGYAGYFTSKTGSDDLRLNTCWVDGYNAWQKKSIIQHEFGHGLDFDHPPRTAYYKKYSIMFWCPVCTGRSIPGQHDGTDYYNRWVR